MHRQLSLTCKNNCGLHIITVKKVGNIQGVPTSQRGHNGHIGLPKKLVLRVDVVLGHSK